MTALCGWIGDALAAPETTSASMGQKLGGTNLQRSASHAPQGALLTAALRRAPQIASDVPRQHHRQPSICRRRAAATGATTGTSRRAAGRLPATRRQGAAAAARPFSSWCSIWPGNKALLAVDRFASINLAYCQHQRLAGVRHQPRH